jgi:hypothetical protein
MDDQYKITRQRVTWIGANRGKSTIRHLWQYVVTEPDGYERYFDRKRDAVAWIADATDWPQVTEHRP